MRRRDELCQKLNKKMLIISTRTKEVKRLQTEINKKYKVPISIANDLLTMRTYTEDADDFVLYTLSEAILGKETQNYFTETELKKYSKMKFEITTLKFPIRYRMVQVSDDQWIGKITVRELIELRDAQIINYNENTQRTMKRTVSQGVEHYRIALNHKAINAIEQSFKSNTYIPNTITLNLPEDANYTYDEDTSELIIDKSDDFKFDILDGYHRYIGISNIKQINNDFDYVMELRIVQFDENRAKQFIWQEDQKTKMRRVDSEALNQTAVTNKIIKRLNIDTEFNLAGQISPNEGIINSGELYLCLNTLYRNEFAKSKNETSMAIRLAAYYKKFINMVTEKDPKLLEEKWDRPTTISIIYSAYKETPDKEAIDTINKYRKVLGEHPEILSRYQKASLNKRDFNRLDGYVKA